MRESEKMELETVCMGWDAHRDWKANAATSNLGNSNQKLVEYVPEVSCALASSDTVSTEIYLLFQRSRTTDVPSFVKVVKFNILFETSG